MLDMKKLGKEELQDSVDSRIGVCGDTGSYHLAVATHQKNGQASKQVTGDLRLFLS